MTEMSSGAERLTGTLDVAIERLERARPFAKQRHQRPVLDVVSRLMPLPGGPEAILSRAVRMDRAGLFGGSDWDVPTALLPQLTVQTLESDDRVLAALEMASLMRFLAVATGTAQHSTLQQEYAQHFLTQVLALNLPRFFNFSDEASRAAGERAALVARLLRFIAERVGLRDVLGVMVAEIWRILEQRPVQVGPVKDMITQIAVALNQQGSEPGAERLGAERLISALFGPTVETLDDPGLDLYRERLGHMDDAGLSREAMGFARSMHDTGLVSDYHVAFLLWALDYPDRPLVPEAMGLGSTGLDCWRHYRGLIEELIRAGVTPATPQALYGLAMLMERGILHHTPIAPALKRALRLELRPAVRERIDLGFGTQASAETHLLAGALEVIGQPLGVGQGANPTCQSARAISMWALNDPDFLLHLMVQAAEAETVLMHFEGQPINSAELPAGLAGFGPIDADPLSVLLVPHLDRIYAEMGRLCAPRGGDPHRWINPEFHGWWVARDCAVAVDVSTGFLDEYDRFVRRFHESYHPGYNGDRPLIHPQPAGIAFTDSTGTFIGWHAITILRVASGRAGETRVYFYNPNNDSGQDWGQGVSVTTSGNGERHGEGSLEFEQFLSRLYLFHDQPLRPTGHAPVPAEAVERVRQMAADSWAGNRVPSTRAADPAEAPSA
ncbi:hypothetical protein [Tranquillimonas alkanivorans]|uniref:Uncharacterized protein n=1 Tax=Tranquillimonas alkanivorans TaxID=441119 RepID=A0A1I5QCW6_9RHOB|nr:hypothetical protein [Tranquillimonas alkanivorans]SFP44138.1 hypothetical protein SAMN04488047_106181 [Tranquillimonas alkanivorans]